MTRADALSRVSELSHMFSIAYFADSLCRKPSALAMLVVIGCH